MRGSIEKSLAYSMNPFIRRHSADITRARDAWHANQDSEEALHELSLVSLPYSFFHKVRASLSRSVHLCHLTILGMDLEM